MKDKTVLIDADSLIFISCYCKNDEVKSLQDCKDIVDNFIKNVLDATKTSRFLLFLTIGKGFRYKVYTDYKANRKSLKPLDNYVEVRKYLVDKYGAISHPELEADDLCLIYNNHIPNSFISSCDKDMLKLEGKHYDYKKHKWFTNTKQEADIYFWTSMITGDVIDNIKGIPGKGEKFAEKLFNNMTPTDSYSGLVLKEYINHFGEIEGIKQFYQNYNALKILDRWEDIEIYEPVEYIDIIDEYKEENN